MRWRILSGCKNVCLSASVCMSVSLPVSVLTGMCVCVCVCVSMSRAFRIFKEPGGFLDELDFQEVKGFL